MSQNRRILLVDDELENLSALKEVIEREGYDCLVESDATLALTHLRNDPSIALIITDLKMPIMNGIEVLQAAKLLRPDVSRVLVTAYGSIEETVSAMKLGAFDVLAKPLKTKVIRELLQKIMSKVPPQTSALREIENPAYKISLPYQEVMQRIQKAASSNAQVLLLGESGSGKTYLAKQLHLASLRCDKPFIALNCAAIPSELLESELFGFEKGAFTGATQSREGKIMAAQNGTLLLDEIGDLPLFLQGKLLQFLQEKKFFRLGSNKEQIADVRILAATHQKLDVLIREGKFREDLAYRLRVIEIEVPPLRSRKDDLYWLVPSILDRLAEKNSTSIVRVNFASFQALYEYNWPGNIRELENVLESALVMSSDEEMREGLLSPLSLPQKIINSPERSPVSGMKICDLASLEKQAIQQALLSTAGNRRLAAQLLGISERTLYRVLGSQSPEAPLVI